MFDKLLLILAIAIFISVGYAILSIFYTSLPSSNYYTPTIQHIIKIPLTIWYYSVDILFVFLVLLDVFASLIFPNRLLGFLDFMFLLGFGIIYFNVQYFLTTAPIVLQPIVSLFQSSVFMIFVLFMLAMSIIFNFRGEDNEN